MDPSKLVMAGGPFWKQIYLIFLFIFFGHQQIYLISLHASNSLGCEALPKSSRENQRVWLNRDLIPKLSDAFNLQVYKSLDK